MLPMPLPKTAASIVPPVSAAIACAAVTVSHETRFSFPSRCSAITRIVSAMFYVVAFLQRSLLFVVLLDVSHRDQQQGDQHVGAEDGAHQHAAGVDVPLHEEPPRR